jgi:hypothetical protein
MVTAQFMVILDSAIVNVAHAASRTAALTDGFRLSLLVLAVLSAVGGLTAFAMLRRAS